MLSRIWLNALPDSSTSVMHSHTTCTFCMEVLIKSSARKINMFAKFPAIPANASITLSNSLHKHSNSLQKHSNACYSHSCFQFYNKMLGTAVPNSGILQVSQKCFRRNSPLSPQGLLSQPACGVIEWFANVCLSFSSSHVAGSKSKRSSRSVFNVIVGDKQPSAVDTSKISKPKLKQRDSFEANVTHSPVNDDIEIPRTNMVMNGVFSKHSTEVAPASSQQGSRSGRLKNNICEKSKKTNLKTDETNGKHSQVSAMEVTVCDKTQASSSSRSMIDEGVEPKKKKSDEKASSKQLHVAARGSRTKVTVDTLRVKSSTRAKDVKDDQPKKANLKKQKTADKASSKQSPTAATDVCDQLLTRSSPRSKVVKDSSTEVTYKNVSAKQSGVTATDSPVEVNRPQIKSIPKEKLVKGDQAKNTTLKKQKIDEKASSKQSCVTFEVVSDKPQPKTSPRKKLLKGDQLKKKDLKMQKSVEKVSANQSQIATRDNSIKFTVSDYMQAKSSPGAKVVKDVQPKKRILKTSKASAKQSQVEAKELSKRGSIEVSEYERERHAPFANAQMKDNTGSKLCKVDKDLCINTEYISGNDNEMNKKQKKITPSHAQGKVVVVVESETKAKTINKYLGDKFVVLASYGHIRDLASKAGSVRPKEGFSMVWEVPSPAWVHIKRIEGALTGARSLILASDPDREGEAIAWHVFEMLKQQRSLNTNMVVQRVVFHEITESAIQKAMESPRDISMNLVNAYHARRALDYLIGFNISPLLWRKLPGCQSAGRVQSAALNLICERENEIEGFVPQEYWSVEAKASNHELPLSGKFCAVVAKVIHVDGKKLERLSIASQSEAEKVVQKISSSKFKIVDLKRGIRQKNPPLPYITSTLQKDASTKLNFSAQYTMKLAQRLYEGVKISDNEVSGLITYIRTDGLRVSEEAAENIRSLVTECYGEAYAVKGVRIFKRKVKNAQEAHEAIRPTDIRRVPSMLANVLEKDLLKLYTLIWCQTMACQMTEAKITQISASFADEEKSVILGSSGSAILFPGYLAVFQDNGNLLSKGEEMKQSDENDNLEIREKEEDGNFLFLTELKIGGPIYMNEVQPLQHATQPQPQYSEGSLISKLEELGIGRPSTYAPIIKTLQDREYITCRNRRIFPEFRGRMVSAFLSHYFSEIIDCSFTASMESQLDKISTGSADWKKILSKFWERFHPVCENVSKVGTDLVENMLTETFRHFLFGALPEEDQTCPGCNKGKLIFKVSRHGAGYFIGCNQYPKCSYIAKTLVSVSDKENRDEENAVRFVPKMLGIDPHSNQQVFLKQGPYGYYIQLGGDVKAWKPKRVGLSKVKYPDNIKLEDALELLRYPIVLGMHPVEKKPIELFRTKFGFVVKCRHMRVAVPKDVDPQAVTVKMTIEYLKGKNVKFVGRHGHKKLRTKIKG